MKAQGGTAAAGVDGRGDGASGGDALGEDALLGGRLVIRQPRRGARVAIDTLLLAAAVPARPGERILELGAGTGAASLALARRVAGVRVTGLERDPAMVRLAEENARLNGLGDACRFVHGDVARLPADMRGVFDRVMANPPHLPARATDAPPDAGRRRAFVEEDDVPLERWVDAAWRALRPRGRLVLIHRADRLADILAAVTWNARFGDVAVLPLWPKAGRPARRLLVAARKGAKGPGRLLPGLVLHRDDGAFTRRAEAVLRDMAALPFDCESG